jgi:hypothetical protein
VRSFRKQLIIATFFLMFSSISMASLPISNLLSTNRSLLAVTSIPIFLIGTTAPSDSIVSVLVTACGSQPAGYEDCFSADNSVSLANTGSLSIITGNLISISIPAIAQPLNYWQVNLPYSTPYTVVRITNSNANVCDSIVTAYNCPTSTTCSTLSFTPVVTCNFS